MNQNVASIALFHDAFAITVFCLSMLGVVLATDFIGVNRGEVIRLWIFLACFCQVPAAYVCARLESRAALAIVLLTTVLQDALGTAMIGFILPGCRRAARHRSNRGVYCTARTPGQAA